MELDIRLITTTVAAIINALGVFLVFIVLSNDSESKLSKIFVAMTVLMLIWVNFAYLARIPHQEELSLIWIRISWSTAIILAVLINLFAIQFLYRRKKFYFLEKFLVILGILFFPIVFFTDYIIEKIQFDSKGILNIIYGDFTLIYFIILAFLTISCVLLFLIKFFSAKSEIEKKNIKYILIGIFSFFILNSIFNIYLPYFRNVFHLYFLGDYSTSIFLSFVAYTIVRHGLFNIRTFAVELITFLIWATFSLRLFWSISWMDRGLNFLLFAFSIIFGIFLIRSVKKEVKQREELERLSHELQHANRELKELDKTKSEFLSIVSHQLRTPLSITKGYVSMILEGIYGQVSDKTKEVLQKVYVSNEGLIALVNNLLDLSRMEAGTIKYNFKDADFVKMVDEIVMELELEAKRRELYLKWEKPTEQMPLIKADEVKLKQVVEILIENSLKYTPKGGVTVSLERGVQSLLFKIQDTGIGINPHEIDHLFSKFGRGKEGQKINATGMGLGLYAAKQIVQAHSGDIFVYSDGIGKGSTFCVRLPIS